MISKLWLLVILLIGLINAKESEKKPMKAAAAAAKGNIDPVTEERLKERWTAFVAEVNKELDFDTNASSQGNVYAVENRDLFLTCAFTKPLRRHRISFLSLKDFSLLFIGSAQHTPDKRFSVSQLPNGQAWTLRLKQVSKRDSGVYECQVNTSPESISLLFNVSVVSGRTRILPPDQLITVNAGGQINLHCVIETGPVEPTFILWYKEGKLVEYSSSRASVTMSASEKGFFSHLIVDNVTLDDGGLYKCDSDLTGEESVQVQVVEQDFKSLYLGSHDLTSSGNAGGVATSSSKSLESVAEVHADEEMKLSKLGPSSNTSVQSTSLLIVLLPFLLVLLKIPGGL